MPFRIQFFCSVLIMMMTSNFARAAEECDETSLTVVVEDVVRTDEPRLHIISSPRSSLRIELRPVFRPNYEDTVHVRIVDAAANGAILGRFDVLRKAMMTAHAVSFSPEGSALLLPVKAFDFPHPLRLFKRDGGWGASDPKHRDRTVVAFAADAYFVDADTVFTSSSQGFREPVRYLISRSRLEAVTSRPARPGLATRARALLIGGVARPEPGPSHPDWLIHPDLWVTDRGRHLALASYATRRSAPESTRHFAIWDLRGDPATMVPRHFDLSARFDLQTYGEPHALIPEKDDQTPIVSREESLGRNAPVVEIVRPGVFLILIGIEGEVTWTVENQHVYRSTSRYLAFAIDANETGSEPKLLWRGPVNLGSNHIPQVRIDHENRTVRIQTVGDQVLADLSFDAL